MKRPGGGALTVPAGHGSTRDARRRLQRVAEPDARRRDGGSRLRLPPVVEHGRPERPVRPRTGLVVAVFARHEQVPETETRVKQTHPVVNVKSFLCREQVLC